MDERIHNPDAASRPTIRDVARVAEVSLGSISNYLSKKAPVSEQHAERIERAIRELNYIPNSAVRVMRGARNPVVGFVIPDAGNPFFTEVARGIEDVAIRAGYVVVSCNTNGEPERENHYVDALAQMRVVGAIVTHQSATPEHLAKLQASGAAVVLLGTPQAITDIPNVDVDDELGGYLAVRHLIDRGRRDIVFVGGPAADVQINNRLRGAHRALDEAGIRPEALRRLDARGSSLALRMAVGAEVAALAPRPTGVFCANDLLALAVESTFMNSGIRVPEDVAIVGYDDIESAALAVRPLTTVRQPQYQIGRVAAELVLQHATGGGDSGQSVRFAPELVERASTTGRD